MLEDCTLCPRNCRVNRFENETGFCGATQVLRISSAHPHFGEEAPLVGRGGSGTIFLTHCNLGCDFCQNWDISHQGSGTDVTIEQLADMMLALQSQGCHNINIVTPTHYSPHVILALDMAAGKGLHLPLVYNTSGWEKPDIMKILNGIVDIYLPDFKFMDETISERLAQEASSYPSMAKQAVLEMHRQVGVAHPDEHGLVHRGLMIRHLVMPNDVSASLEAIRWIAAHLPKDTYLNVMPQYRPAHKAADYPEINRPITNSEYITVLNEARSLGLSNLDRF
jgi:putative pyruvate formate lyase activating enzyme